VAHEDRLARFGVVWVGQLLVGRGCALRVIHPKTGGSVGEELVAVVAGRVCGQRSAAARQRLLERAAPGGGGGTTPG